MADFEVGGHLYSSQKMDARTQLHVSRRIAPLFAEFAAVMTSDNPQTPDPQMPALSTMGGQDLKQLAEALAKMSDSDVDYVINACLRLVRRANRTISGEVSSWSGVWNEAAQRLQFEDITLPQMMEVVQTIIMEELGGFFDVAPSSLPAPAAAA
jgi:hypothetical protein